MACLSEMPNFSVKEKDEARPLNRFFSGFVECLHSPLCRGLKVFFSALALVSQPLTPRYSVRPGLSLSLRTP